MWHIGAFCRFLRDGLAEHVVAYRCIFGCVLDFSGFKNGWWPPFLRSWPIGAIPPIR